MAQQGVFHKDQSALFQKVRRIAPISGGVLKKHQVRIARTRRIDHEVQVAEHHQPGKITPVYNESELIGVLYECTCGKVAQILFDFEESEQAPLHSAIG